MAKITIDDKEIEVPDGTLIIDAAERAGVYIPRFCYHPKLVPVGMCRMCIVDVETPRGPARRPVTSCTERVSDGMIVRTNTDNVKAIQRSVLEFLLINHPLDCPICDKGGECDLQDQTFDYGPDVSRYHFARRNYVKPIPLSDTVLLDRERCIQCGRCTRFCDEIAGEKVLHLFDRGYRMEVATFFGEPFASHFSGNTIDLCPVGALTSTTFRFRARPWEMERVPSVCPYCSCGCNLHLHVRQNDLKRVVPRQNEAVNEVWLCDKGRFDYFFIGHPDRLRTPLLRRDGELVEASWDEALDYVAERLTGIVVEHGPDSVGGIGSSVCSNEDNYLFQKFFRSALGTNNVAQVYAARPFVVRHGSAVPPDASVSLEELEQARTFFLPGLNLIEELPIAWLRVYKAVRRKGARLLALNVDDPWVQRAAAGPWTCTPGTEVTLLRGLIRLLTEEEQHSVDFIRTRCRGFAGLREEVADYPVERVVNECGLEETALRDLAAQLAAAENLVIFAPSSASGRAGERESGRAGEGSRHDLTMTPTHHDTNSPLTTHHSPILRDAAWNLALTLGCMAHEHGGFIEVLRDCNAHGASDMGMRPDCLPGYQSVTDEAVRTKFAAAWGGELPATPGLDYAGMLAAAGDGLKALYIMGADPLSDTGSPFAQVRNQWFPSSPPCAEGAGGGHTVKGGADTVAEALERLELLVVQDLFLTETAKRADVVLPTVSFAEKDGTFTNFEGRVQRFTAGLRPPGAARPDRAILADLAERVRALRGTSAGPGPTAARDVLAEIAELTPLYADAPKSWAKDSEGVRVSAPATDVRFEFALAGGAAGKDVEETEVS
jgi:NADH-quinone oxidoreductase chain G